MKNKKILAGLLALTMSTAIFSGTVLTACEKPQETTNPPVVETTKPSPTKPTTPPTTKPTTPPTTNPPVVDDKIDWSKAEVVDPGYGNIGTYKQVEYSLTSEKSGLKIGGFLNVPSNFDPSKKYPLVIMSHGIAGSVTTYDQNYVAYFLEKDVLCFTYFFCGGGAPDTRNKSRIRTTSEGDSKNMSLLTEKDDLLSVLNDMSKKSFVDTKKIVLMGESMGGAVTGITAPEVSERIAGEILCYPAVSINDDIMKVYMRFNRIPEMLNNNGLVLNREVFYRDIRDIDLVGLTASFPKKACLLHGTSDGTVSISYSEKLSKLYKDVNYKVIKGGKHGFTNAALKEVIPHIMTYLKEIGVIADAKIEVGDKSGTFVGNHNEGDPEGGGGGGGVSGTALKPSEGATVLYTVKDKSGKQTLTLYSDGILKAGTKTGEWRYIDGVLTIGIVGNSIYSSVSNEDFTTLTVVPAWFGSLFTFEINEEEFKAAIGDNHGLVDRFDWVGEYR